MAMIRGYIKKSSQTTKMSRWIGIVQHGATVRLQKTDHYEDLQHALVIYERLENCKLSEGPGMKREREASTDYLFLTSEQTTVEHGQAGTWQEIHDWDAAHHNEWVELVHNPKRRLWTTRQVLVDRLPQMVPAELVPNLRRQILECPLEGNPQVLRPMIYAMLRYLKLEPQPGVEPRYEIVTDPSYASRNLAMAGGRHLPYEHHGFNAKMCDDCLIGHIPLEWKVDISLYLFIQKQVDAGRLPAKGAIKKHYSISPFPFATPTEFILDRHTGCLYTGVFYGPQTFWQILVETFPPILQNPDYLAFLKQARALWQTAFMQQNYPETMQFHRDLRHIEEGGRMENNEDTKKLATNILAVFDKNVRRIVLPREEAGSYWQILIETKPKQLFATTDQARIITFHLTSGTTQESVRYSLAKEDKRSVGTFSATLLTDGRFYNRYSERWEELQALMQAFNADPVGFLNRASKQVGICWVCAKALVSAESLEKGMGATCAKKMHEMERMLK